jgi:hypothetical protein
MMRIRHIHAFDHDFDISVERVAGQLKITVTEGDKIRISRMTRDGESVPVNF